MYGRMYVVYVVYVGVVLCSFTRLIHRLYDR